MDIDDIAVLQRRQASRMTNIDWLEFQDATYLFYENKKVNKHNLD